MPKIIESKTRAFTSRADRDAYVLKLEKAGVEVFTHDHQFAVMDYPVLFTTYVAIACDHEKRP